MIPGDSNGKGGRLGPSGPRVSHRGSLSVVLSSATRLSLRRDATSRPGPQKPTARLVAGLPRSRVARLSRITRRAHDVLRAVAPRADLVAGPNSKRRRWTTNPLEPIHAGQRREGASVRFVQHADRVCPSTLREKIVTYLQQNSSIIDPNGRATTRLYEALGRPGTMSACSCSPSPTRVGTGSWSVRWQANGPTESVSPRRSAPPLALSSWVLARATTTRPNVPLSPARGSPSRPRLRAGLLRDAVDNLLLQLLPPSPLRWCSTRSAWRSWPVT